jgi:hypothetical protein
VGWTIHFIERETRYWIDAQAGQKRHRLFEQGTRNAWEWAAPATFIRWFTDGERRGSVLDLLKSDWKKVDKGAKFNQ